MSGHQIPRKEVGQPSPAHLKEVEARTDNWNSGWDLPEENPQKRNSKFGAGTGVSRLAIADRFNRILPPYKRYFGRSRRTLLVLIGVILLCLLALIIGLAVGLKGGSKYVWEHVAICYLTLI